jgi:hypothetical protein
MVKRPRIEATPPPPTSDANDFLWGAGEIARALGRTESQVYTMVAAGLLPVKKLSHKRLVASRSALRRLLISAE